MSIRASVFLVAVVAILCLFTGSAYAQDCSVEYCTEYQDYGFGSWGDPSGGGGYYPPSTTACHAYSSIGQRCRDCADAYDDQGRPKGYKVCAYVSRAARCECTGAGTSNCTASGSCTYGV